MGREVSESCVDSLLTEMVSSYCDRFYANKPELAARWPPAIRTVPFPSLENLRISCMPYLKIIWHNQFTADSFCKPQIMKVEFCENLTFQETCAVTAPQLNELHLIHLPKLKHIWNKDPQQIFSLQKPLESMESPFPGAEEDFPEIEGVDFDNDGQVKEIVLRNEKSSVSP